MIFLKTDDEIELLRQSNLLVGRTLAEVAKLIKPGVTTKELDKVAEEFIRDNGAVPTFKGFPNQYGDPFPSTLCTSVNDQVVHGIPNDIPLKEGDIVSVDCGTYMNGFCGDSAYTFCVGEVDPEVLKLLKTTKEALYLGIENAIHGKRLGDIGFAVQQHCEANSYGVVAGGAMRAVLESVGVTDVLAKSKGSSNPHNLVKATILALGEMRDARMVAQNRGVSMEKVFRG